MRLFFILFALGIATVQFLSALPGTASLSLYAWIVCLFLLLAQVLFVPGPRSSSPFKYRCLIACLVFCLGFSWALWRGFERLADELPGTAEGSDITVVGVVSGLPNRFPQGERFEFDVEQVETPGMRVPQHIALSWYRNRNQEESVTPAWVVNNNGQFPAVGERWRLTVRLKQPHGNANWHGFDYEAWLWERNIRATGSLRPKGVQVRLEPAGWQPKWLVERARAAVRERFDSLLPEAPYAGILVALAVGDQNSIDDALWQVFNRTGTTHLMSISGLHVTMVAALLAWVAGALWRRSPGLVHRLPAQKAAALAGMLAALGYALLAGFAVPAQRTFYMLAVVAWALWQGRSLAPSHILPAALAIVLLFDPWAVLSSGFWLSFSAVGILLLAGHGRYMQEIKRNWRERIRAWGAAQWAVTLGTLPLLLVFFQQFSLVSPLANAVAIPVVSLLVTPLVLLAAVVPSPPILDLAHFILELLMRGLIFLASDDSILSVWSQAAPSAWSLPFAALGVFCLILPGAVPGRSIGFLLLLPALFPVVTRPAPREAEITVIDVGQGSAVHVRTATHDLLYDAGPVYGVSPALTGDMNNAGARTIYPYLRGEGVDRLTQILVSHRDNDHSGGLASLLSLLPVDEMSASFDFPHARPCRAGQTWEWDGVSFAVLHPPGEAYSQNRPSNHLSCVLRIEAGGQSMLLTGDIERSDEAWMVSEYGERLKTTILLVPHHGSRTSSSVPFITATDPREVVFSAGYRNRFGHPRPDIVDRYAALSQTRLWRTDRDGAIRIHLGGTYRVEAYRSLYRRYWQWRQWRSAEADESITSQ